MYTGGYFCQNSQSDYLSRYFTVHLPALCTVGPELRFDGASPVTHVPGLDFPPPGSSEDTKSSADDPADRRRPEEEEEDTEAKLATVQMQNKSYLDPENLSF